MVSELALERYIDMYFSKFHIRLSQKEAIEQAINFLTLMKILIYQQNSASLRYE